MGIANRDANDAANSADAVAAVAASADNIDLSLPSGCPFLLAEGGGWRLGLPSRDHRCAAFSPPAPLSPEKQARLCLTPTHTACATYIASLSARTSRLGAPSPERATRWGLARTTTVIEDPGGLRARAAAFLLDRRRWPAIPAVLLVTTLFTLALSGFRGGSSIPASSSPSPGHLGTTPATAPPRTPAPSTGGTAEPSEPATTPRPTPRPSATPRGTAGPVETFRTYRVKSGDTLSSIASVYGTTPKAIAQLNGITVSSTLHIGQVLKIPN
jgi:LysM repeat protein